MLHLMQGYLLLVPVSIGTFFLLPPKVWCVTVDTVGVLVLIRQMLQATSEIAENRTNEPVQFGRQCSRVAKGMGFGAR